MDTTNSWFNDCPSNETKGKCPECFAPTTTEMDYKKEVEVETCLKCDFTKETDFWDTELGQQQIYSLANKFRNREGVRL